jgi:hypothetical protein
MPIDPVTSVTTDQAAHLQMVFEVVSSVLPLPEDTREVTMASMLLQGCFRYVQTPEDMHRWARLAHDILTLMTHVYIQITTAEETRCAD